MSEQDTKATFKAPDVSRDEIEYVKLSFRELQDDLCATFSRVADNQHFFEDNWAYQKGSGGGRTRIWGARDDWLANGQSAPARAAQSAAPPRTAGSLPYWEKGGVGYSGIHGTDLPAAALRKWDVDVQPGTSFVATGVSLVMHPSNPWVPSVHANVRFFHAAGVWWFGGGIDVTPYYPIPEQMARFHSMLAELYAEHGVDYAAHKRMCDSYFYLPHRDETRGVGGVFFDSIHLNDGSFHDTLEFVLALGRLVGKVVELFEENAYRPFTPIMRDFQRYRRGRYVEFNLLFDRGTKFGISSGGRTESILMSLPATVHWDYNWKPIAGSMEAYLYEHFLQAQPWHCESEAERSALMSRLAPPASYARYAPRSTKQFMPTTPIYERRQVIHATLLVSLAAAAVIGFQLGKRS